MHIIRILARANAAATKPNLPLLLVHALYPAHNPFSLRNLILHRAGFGVKKVKMIPPIAFGHPNDFIGLLQIFRETLAGIINEGLAFFVDKCLNAAVIRIDRENPEDLVAALIVKKSKPGGVTAPSQFGDRPGIGEKGVVYGDLVPGFAIEQVRLVNGNLIAWLQIGIRL